MIALTEAVRTNVRTGDVDMDALLLDGANRVLVALKRHGWTAETGEETALVGRRLWIAWGVWQRSLAPADAGAIRDLLGEFAGVFGA